jgi:hypothetical protein
MTTPIVVEAARFLRHRGLQRTCPKEPARAARVGGGGRWYVSILWGCAFAFCAAVDALAQPTPAPKEAAPAPQLHEEWRDLTELQRAERVIQFGCLKSLINQLVAEKVATTKQYVDGSSGRRVSYKRYENENAWVDLEARLAWSKQEDKPGYFTVRRAKIKNIAHYRNISFLENAGRLAVRRFFQKPEHSAVMRTSGNHDIIPGEVAEVTFEFENDKLRSLEFDCSL